MRSTVSLAPSPALTGNANFRSLTVNSTAQEVLATSGNVVAISVLNRHSASIYVKLYDIAAADVTPASDTPVQTLLVPASSQVILRGADCPWSFSTACAVRAVTDSGDTGTTAPATLPIIEIETQA